MKQFIYLLIYLFSYLFSYAYQRHITTWSFLYISKDVFPFITMNEIKFRIQRTVFLPGFMKLDGNLLSPPKILLKSIFSKNTTPQINITSSNQ